LRQIVLDTETTGLDASQGHRIIEIGCVELRNRRLTGNTFHYYLNPDREIEDGAYEVHGINNDSLADKPRFSEIAREFIDFIRDSELIIHNAPFDVGFLNAEFALLGSEWGRVEDYCEIVDTLMLARDRHPGQKNSLDALCLRYEVDNSQRDLHGALLDARILVDVYLAMTGGQTTLSLDDHAGGFTMRAPAIREVDPDRSRLPVIQPDKEELAAHQDRLDAIEAASGKKSVWRRVISDE